jgi:glycosyltransferase involved in cell wall biosynthesis
MRVLQIGSDRSKRGILHPDSPASLRQKAYGEVFGQLDVIGFSLISDGAAAFDISPHVRVYPTGSSSKLLYGRDAIALAKALSKPDVVSAQDPFEAGLAAWMIARRLRVPLHVQVHTDLLSPGFARHSLLNRIRVFIARFVLKRAARIRVVSTSIKEKIEARYHLSAPITVVPLFFDAERFRNAQSDPVLESRFSDFKFKLLYVGRLEAEKNVSLAITAFAAAAPENACLIILGAGSEKAMLEALAKRLGLDGRIFFEGERDPASYYNLADLVLLTSHYEGYPGVVAEALSGGVPVISTNAGAAREIGAMIAKQESFAEALKRWFESGPREGVLKSQPYKDFNDYVRAYCADIAACAVDK